MQPYGIPTDQYDTYMKSEHAHALLVKGDLAAPACNDCHGNHGATPPEVNSVANVCGQCHGREASLFEKSTHKAIFEEIGEPACVTCHDNHLVRHPTPELFMTHSMPEVSSGRVTATNPFSADIGHVSAADTVTAVWRSVLSSHLPADDLRYRHQVEVAAEDMPPILLDATLVPGASIVPEVVRGVSSNGSSASLSIEPLYGLPVEPGDAVLFTLQFHAGANGPVSNVTIRDLPGEAVQSGSGSVCMQCHVPGDSCDTATAELYVSLSHMERRLRAGAAILHRAEIAGMEVSGPQFELKSEGTTAAVESRALIHTFDRVRMLERAADGLAAANAAVKAGEDALAELQVRRKGLAVSLLLIVLVLVGLYLKIRDINRIRREEAVEQ
jgi:hypothetical protein